ncbi:hypothetical protein JVX98_19395 [Ensifer sp. PDNC004]|uniref:hypothetical protein n=1 Tax=Ensifer sp. PDNC004 TaxID=2811423 RepID=UPI00196541FA|nr:hypothetical protein [Ensifer sp. PDNC004]QRY66562.1 hypothetical protein JVX98_19395 [Ensifer sp. PDNC004]
MGNALSRRALLAAPLLVTACAAAPAVAAPVSISDELKWLIGTYDDIAAQRDTIRAEIVRIIDLPDQPCPAELVLSEIATREMDYSPDWRDKPLYSEAGIQKYFTWATSMVWLPERSRYLDRMAADRDKALSLYRMRRQARAQWLAETGMEALEDQHSALDGKLHEIEKWLRAYTCRSLGDVIAIAAFADRWLPDDELDIDARSDLLRAISAYATAAA